MSFSLDHAFKPTIVSNWLCRVQFTHERKRILPLNQSNAVVVFNEGSVGSRSFIANVTSNLLVSKAAILYKQMRSIVQVSLVQETRTI
eukprot:6200718-Pleurochrysis_carterae.AAC.1